jgi:LmbE family N-acetylglucosaminyl deacetylase
MPKAIAVVAHHDDHVLWMGGAIQRLAALGWHWTVIAMCVSDQEKHNYFHHTCSIFGAIPITMQFADYQVGEAFSKNIRAEMKSRIAEATAGRKYDLVFTHSRSEHGEYWGRHANHVEVREVTFELVKGDALGLGPESLSYFAYDVIYGGGTATCARHDANFYLQLTYPELIWKCQLSALAPDANSSLRNLAFPCPNPEGFEGDALNLSEPFVRRQ